MMTTYSSAPANNAASNPVAHDLRALLPLTVTQFLQLAPKIAAELAALHQCGALHLSICPEAIGVMASGEALLLASTSFKQRPGTHGRAPYLAPEQTGRLNRPVDQRSDLYALGITFYELLAGRLPFTADDLLEWIHCHIARAPLPLSQTAPAVPPPVAAIVMRLIAKSADERYQSASGLQADLERCREQWETQGRIVDFTPGEADRSDRFVLPERLYGREAELEALSSIFEHGTTRGRRRLALITGDAGIGKTALAHTLQPLVARRQGFFLYGACDPRDQALPYAALTQALQALVEQLLTASEERLALWRGHLQAALGEGGQAMLDLVPDIALIIGPQRLLPTLGPTESQHRLALLFQRFVQALARPETPLVLVLDNAQWIDPPTLALLRTLALDNSAAHLLLLLAYRDAELDEEHPLTRWLTMVESAGVHPEQIVLRTLDQRELAQLVADAAPMPVPDASRLAQLLLAKSGGNPFFARELLATLHREQALAFDYARSNWHWDETAAAAIHAGDDTTSALLLGRLRHLPPVTVKLLQAAACAGMRFDLATIAAAAAAPIAEALSALTPALEAGLINQVEAPLALRSENTQPGYHWRSDQIRLAVYARSDAEERRVLHRAIGHYQLMQPVELRDPFVVVGQYTQSGVLPDEPAERALLAQVAWEAGRRARAANAYAPARAAFDLAAALQPDTPSQESYQQRFELLFARAESTYMSGAFAEAEQQFLNLLAACANDLDRARIYDIRLKLYQVAGRYSDGVTLAVEALQMFGVAIPSEGDDLQAALAAEIAAIPVNMAGREIAALIDAPLVQDPAHRAIINLLANLAPCAYIGRPEIFPVVGLMLLNASLRYGNTPESCFAYSVYGLMLVSAFGDIPSGCAFSEMSLRLNERLNDITLRGTLLHLHGDHINFWQKHIASDIPILERAFAACLEAGDMVYSGFVAFEIIWQFIERGDALATLEASAAPYLSFARQAQNEPVADTIRLQLQFARALQGRTDANHTLDDDNFSEADCLARVTAASFGCGIVFYHSIKLLLHYTFERYEEALAAADAAVPVLGAAMAMPIEATYAFYRALTLTALLRDESRDDHEALRVDLELQYSRLQLWARHGPDNFLHRERLVAAEIAALEGRDLEAQRLYEQARTAARDSGFTHYAALAGECAARYYRTHTLTVPALAYLREAHADYAAWGANAKLNWLNEHYPLPAAVEASPIALPPMIETTPDSAPISTDQLDLISVLKASQALSSEMVLERLLTSLLQIVLEYAGGVRAVLLLEEQEQPLLVASASVAADGIQVMQQHKEIQADTDQLPFTLLSYVRRRREPMVLDDASGHTLFAGDDYVRRTGLRSALCMPMVRQATLVGTLYLEHPTIAGVFTSERLSVLEILMTQAAISLENARLYSSIQHESAERLRAEQERLALQEQVIEAQQAALRELSTPLMPISAGVVVMPIVGALDSARAQQIMETLLEGIAAHDADLAILDITGVKVVDTQVAGALIRAAQAAALLGTRVVLSGIGPEVAQTLVHIGADLREMVAKRSLQQAITYALAQRTRL